MADPKNRDPDADEGQCGDLLIMWDGEYEDSCVLPLGHDGRHWDRFAAWDDEYVVTTGVTTLASVNR